MATALTPQTDVTSGKCNVADGEPETVVSASLQKVKSIKNPIKHFLFFYFIKSETSDSFVNHFAHLKTLDFYFNTGSIGRMCLPTIFFSHMYCASQVTQVGICYVTVNDFLDLNCPVSHDSPVRAKLSEWHKIINIKG